MAWAVLLCCAAALAAAAAHLRAASLAFAGSPASGAMPGALRGSAAAARGSRLPRAAWDADLSAFEGLSPDEWLDGTVARTAPFGAFVSVRAADGTEADGLVHISQIRDGFVENVDDEVSEGQEVKVRVLSVDAGRGRMSLTMKEPGAGGGAPAREPVNLAPFEGTPSEKWLDGTVARTAPFGAFVTVKAEDGTAADGLVHITQIRDGFVESVDDELQAGQEVQVRVVSVDVGAGKLGLSMKSPEF